MLPDGICMAVSSTEDGLTPAERKARDGHDAEEGDVVEFTTGRKGRFVVTRVDWEDNAQGGNEQRGQSYSKRYRMLALVGGKPFWVYARDAQPLTFCGKAKETWAASNG